MITNVMVRVNRRRLSRARIAAALHGLLSIAAIVALMPAYRYLASRAAASGFSAYLSLLEPDGSALAHSWQAFLLTLVESAPIAGFVLILGILLVLAYGARKTAGDLSRMHIGAVQA